VVEHESDQRLSQIPTLWTVVSQAHGDGPTDEIRSAQEQLLARYGKVVRRYLLGALRDHDAADEVAQEFALRFVRGDLKGADRQRGRFRDFLKGALFHMIGDFHRRRMKQPQQLAAEHDLRADESDTADSDEKFLETWRLELLDRTWRALANLQNENGSPFYTVLQFRADFPEMRSGEMATQLSQRLGHSVTAVWVRQTLHRAREKMATLLLEEVQHTLTDPTLEQLEDELLILGLHGYCQPALEQARSVR
jgi:DNA-directed RNA polymerase specialized sigma24 family protein